jgi:hypothetical protein
MDHDNKGNPERFAPSIRRLFIIGAAEFIQFRSDSR